MRPAFLIFGLVSISTGCSNYVTERVIPTGCAETNYYLDADQDGWGANIDADSDGVPDYEVSCEAKGQYTALNALDCDDSDTQTTGKIGSVCPQNTVKGTSEFASRVVGTREYVAILGDTIVGEKAAATACSAQGWGGRWGNDEPGGLATFSSMQGMFRLINNI